MNDLNQQALARYRNNFLKEVEAHVEEGEWVKMCMQCGVCAGSCPFGPDWEHSPQKIFMMIRAGKREEVLTSDSMWMCTSCYNCVVRCPRQLPITQIMHGLATYAHRLGLAPKDQPTRHFSQLFWKNCTRTGRVNELKLTLGLYFKDGLIAGIKKAWALRNIGLGMLLAKRLNPFELLKGHECEDKAGIQNMLKKAYELENKQGRHSEHAQESLRAGKSAPWLRKLIEPPMNADGRRFPYSPVLIGVYLRLSAVALMVFLGGLGVLAVS